jgi:hypothetical protein
MKSRLLIAGLWIVAAGSSAKAQTCSGGALVVDACRKTVDLVNFLTPQIAAAQAGGNATLGQGGALGGLGKVVLDVRGTVVMGSLPRFDNVGFSPTETGTSFASASHFVPAASANAAIGLWRGYSLGVTHVAGIDALLTATYLPDFSGGSVTGKVSGGNVKLGYGLRVGVLEESLISPGVSLTLLERDLPTFSVTGTAAGSGAANPGGTIAINDFAVKTRAWRLTASKSLPLLGGLSAGFGQDTYDASSNIVVTVNPGGLNPGGSGSGSAGMSMTRTNMFLGLTLNLLLARLVAELGQVTGGSTPVLLNDFGSPANKSRVYFTAGVRIGF